MSALTAAERWLAGGAGRENEACVATKANEAGSAQIVRSSRVRVDAAIASCVNQFRSV